MSDVKVTRIPHTRVYHMEQLIPPEVLDKQTPQIQAAYTLVAASSKHTVALRALCRTSHKARELLKNNRAAQMLAIRCGATDAIRYCVEEGYYAPCLKDAVILGSFEVVCMFVVDMGVPVTQDIVQLAPPKSRLGRLLQCYVSVSV